MPKWQNFAKFGHTGTDLNGKTYIDNKLTQNDRQKCKQERERERKKERHSQKIKSERERERE